MMPALRSDSGASSDIASRPSPTHRPSVIHAIYNVMSQTPHAIAVTDGPLEWTYAALRERAEIVAKSLAGHGITRGSVVGMHLPRCADAVATMLGIMASGCVYLPLDPSYPSVRLRFMLDRSDAAAVISDGNDPDLYGSHRIWLPSPSRLATEPEVPASGISVDSTEAEPFRMEDRAYILFTSGSTGEPKGVMVTHENVALMTEWLAKILSVTPFDASATVTSLSFDPSFQEILLPLSVGGTVHVISHALALGQLTRPVSFVACTPTVASELLRAGLLPHLKVLMVGGEPLAPDVAARLLSSGRVERLLNCYGPTECTVCVTVAEVTAPVPEVIPIGRQVPGTEVLILDENGQPLPDGKVGEVCIFGGQVTDGYVNDPAGTAERFIVRLDPAGGSQRYYRTGDLGYRLDDGAIYFRGRADRQVKINGSRIELGEIDAALRSHPQVSDATTIVQDDRAVAYVVPADAGVDVDILDLKRHLSENLPRFMLPAGVVVLAELPKTVNGKLDDSALPHWSPGRSEHEPLAIDDSTARVIEIVADVTGFVGQILPSDDFINDLGGTSLGIVRVLVELERDSGRRMQMSDALANTSVAGLASLLRGDSESGPADFAFNTDGSAPPLFLLHAYLGGMLRLRRLAELLPSDQPVYGLQVHSNSEQISDSLTIASLALDALNRIRAIQPTGRITIGGCSAGGLIVFETARRLFEEGDPEPRVLMFDSVLAHSTFGHHWGEWVLNWRENWRDLASKYTEPLRPARRRRSDSQDDEAENDDLVALAKKYQLSTSVLIRRYKAQMYNGDITVMRTRQGRMMALGRRDLGWSSVTEGTLSIIAVPGTHLSMFETPHVHVVAESVNNWLSRK
jgi:amino acid adenylation domain-containing protein